MSANRYNKISSESVIPIPSISGIVAAGADQLSGVIAIKPIAKYLTGARAILRINGKILGFAFQVSWKIDTPVTEIRTIDEYVPVELAPQHVSVTGSIGGFRIPGLSPTKITTSSSLIQKDDVTQKRSFHFNDGESQNIQPTIMNFLHQKYITIEVRDSQTDKLIFFTQKAMITSRTENIKAEDIATIQLEWRSIGWRDETDLKPVTGTRVEPPKPATPAADPLGVSGKPSDNNANATPPKTNRPPAPKGLHESTFFPGVMLKD